jgi:hypothetical protein
MKKVIFVLLLIPLFYFAGCDKTTDPINEVDSEITAKEKVSDVLQRARTDFAADANLSAIYGLNVSLNGTVDLMKYDNAFVYVVQSNALKSNEFYVPVLVGFPVKSPINFTTMLSLVKDSTAENILDKVFGRLSTIAIDPNANYNDSPATIDTALVHGGNTFLTQNSDAKIDMFLLPGKSIDTTLTVNNSADWIVNFYSSSKSLVLWIRSDNGQVIPLSAN